MKETEIHFTGLGIGNKKQAKICIYDLNNNLICQNKTCSGKIKVLLKEKQFYKIVANNNYEVLSKVIYHNCNKYVLAFSNSIISNNRNNRNLTFLLMDRNYPNLPIQKGTMIFG